jgi:hypothetical protein
VENLRRSITTPRWRGQVIRTEWSTSTGGNERVAKRAVRVFEPAELEAIEPEAAAVLTDVGVDAADPQRAKRCR